MRLCFYLTGVSLDVYVDIINTLDEYFIIHNLFKKYKDTKFTRKEIVEEEERKTCMKSLLIVNYS